MRLDKAIKKADANFNASDDISVVLFCTEDNRYAIVEVSGWPRSTTEVRYEGSIWFNGTYWFFDRNNDPTKDPQVCNDFGSRGLTMMGADAPANQADHVYKTSEGFDRALRRIDPEYPENIW